MGYEDDDAVGFFGFEDREEGLTGVGVEPGGGLVEEEERRGAVEGSGDGQTLPLAHAEFGALVKEAAERRVIALRQRRDEREQRVGDVGSVRSVGEGDILVDGDEIAPEVLEEDRHRGAEGVKVKTTDVGAIEEDAALLGVVEPKKEVDDGGLADAVVALEGCDFAAAGGEVEVAEDITLHAGIAEDDVAELDGRDVGRNGERIGGRDDCWLKGEKLEEIGEEEAIVVETGEGGDEGRQSAQPAAEGLEEHDKGADREDAACGASGQEGDDEEHGCRLDDGTEERVGPETAGDGDNAGGEAGAGAGVAGAEERFGAEGAELLGVLATGEHGGEIGREAEERGVLPTETIDDARLGETDNERGDDGNKHDRQHPPRRRGEDDDDADDGDGRGEEGHDGREDLDGA